MVDSRPRQSNSTFFHLAHVLVHLCAKSSPSFDSLILMASCLITGRLPAYCSLSLEKCVTSLKKETNLIGKPERWSKNITHPQAPKLLLCAETRHGCFRDWLHAHNTHTWRLSTDNLEVYTSTQLSQVLVKKQNEPKIRRILQYRFHMSKAKLWDQDIALTCILFTPSLSHLDLETINTSRKNKTKPFLLCQELKTFQL